jgi:hypothetical protein
MIYSASIRCEGVADLTEPEHRLRRDQKTDAERKACNYKNIDEKSFKITDDPSAVYESPRICIDSADMRFKLLKVRLYQDADHYTADFRRDDRSADQY